MACPDVRSFAGVGDQGFEVFGQSRGPSGRHFFAGFDSPHGDILIRLRQMMRPSTSCLDIQDIHFETSADGVTWTTNVADGSFANIQNNPSLQEVAFAAVSARYFRFISLHTIWGSGWTSAAEISVLPASRSGD